MATYSKWDGSFEIPSGGSALLDAITKGKIHLAKFILDAVGHPDVVNTKDFKGKTPLIRVAYIKEERIRYKALQLLLQKRANVNIRDDEGRTALSYACELRCNDMVQLLVKNNVDPDLADHKGNTPLMYSAMIGNDKAIDVLIKSFRRLGLNVDRKNDDGWTPLLIAAKYGYISCASLLAIEGRASVTIVDPEKNMTAEEWARAQGCTTPEINSFSVISSSFPHRRRKANRSDHLGHLGIYGRSRTSGSRISLRSDTLSIDSTKRRLRNYHSPSKIPSPTKSAKKQSTNQTPEDVQVLSETMTDLNLNKNEKNAEPPTPLPPPIVKLGKKPDDNRVIENIPPHHPKVSLYGCHPQQENGNKTSSSLSAKMDPIPPTSPSRKIYRAEMAQRTVLEIKTLAPLRHAPTRRNVGTNTPPVNLYLRKGDIAKNIPISPSNLPIIPAINDNYNIIDTNTETNETTKTIEQKPVNFIVIDSTCEDTTDETEDETTYGRNVIVSSDDMCLDNGDDLEITIEDQRSSSVI